MFLVKILRALFKFMSIYIYMCVCVLPKIQEVGKIFKKLRIPWSPSPTFFCP